jgi:hypothetical protein
MRGAGADDAEWTLDELYTDLTIGLTSRLVRSSLATERITVLPSVLEGVTQSKVEQWMLILENSSMWYVSPISLPPPLRYLFPRLLSFRSN